MTHLNLDADGVARIGLMFLDGDELEKAVIDGVGQVDYDFQYFNRVKKIVMKIEKINPSLKLTAVVWQKKPENDALMMPMVAGSQLPREGHSFAVINKTAGSAFDGVFGGLFDRGDGTRSRYYPVRNSDHEIIAVLELLEGERVANDI